MQQDRSRTGSTIPSPEPPFSDGRDKETSCPLAGTLAEKLRAARDDLTRRWLDRIIARVAVDAQEVFPSDDLLDHIPLLLDGIADYMEDPADEITADVPVIAKAMELGELRLAQGFGAHEILKEYEILGGVLFSYLVGVVDTVDEECTRGELLACGQRLFRAIAIIQQVTANQYLRTADEHVREREDRLRGFNRTVSHELKNRLGAALGASAMLSEAWVQEDPEQRAEFIGAVARNLETMKQVLEDLLALSQIDRDARQQRNVMLPQAIAEAARQLREMADDRGVRISLAEELPRVEVDAAAVELCLVNYISNGIKYADPDKQDRWVHLAARKESHGEREEVVIEVRDNGIGVPPESRDQLFDRFYRVRHTTGTGAEGSGLGLSIVRETIESIGGRAWAEFPDDDGSTFKIALPSRRAGDEQSG